MSFTFKKPIILDGATGTQLQARGFTGDVASEQWVLEHPQTILEIQKNYIDAGSNIVYASTFGANRIKLAEHHIYDRTEEMNTSLVALSRQAAQNRAMVAGDLSPCGKFLSPMGDTSFEELVDVYTEQAAALEKAGADLFVIETTMTVPEARAAVLAVRSVSTKPIFVTFTCGENGKTLTGTDITAALMIMQGMGVDAFGMNCSTGPDAMLTQIRRLSEYAEIPLIAKPNAGLPEMENGKTVYRCTPEAFAAYTEAFAAAGVAVFGGCCGSTPDHIRVLSEKAASVSVKEPAPLHPDLLQLSTEKEVFLLPADAEYGDVITCSEDLQDDFFDAEDGDEPLIALRIESEEDLEYFEENQYAAAKPICFLCEDVLLLEKALRLYQGRALYEGSLDKEALSPLVKKYGLCLRP